MRHGFVFVAGLVALLVFSSFTMTSGSAAVPAASSYRRDAKGLEAEYQPFLNAFNKGQAPPFDKEFADLTLPDPAEWFGQYFEPEQVQALVVEYEAQVAAEQKSHLLLMTKFWPSGTHFKVHCKSQAVVQAKFPPREGAYVPKSAVPIEQFELIFEANKPGQGAGRSMSSLVNMVWVDGAYRYLGKGAYPFWSMPSIQEQKRQK